jgi:hypothetical protein
MAREKLWRNVSGEYNYQFNWIDENGTTCGFNDVWAPNKREAVKKAKKMETKAHWSLWDEDKREYVTVPNKVEGKGHCFRMEGMYVDTKSMYKATFKQADDMNRLGWMMTI